ncbi:MAG TPA: aldo/keto reductase [Terracidiphilus sp.]|nr:aldo/keto reductase [Terracidiphilus sp.]
MSQVSRRKFVQGGLAAGALASVGPFSLEAQGAKATDWVTLGKSNVKVTRLAFGTGTHNGQVQRDLGQDGFNRLVRHAYDRGIRFFETAEAYPDMHRMLGIALKGIPRENYRLMTKMTTDEGPGVDPVARIQGLLKESQTDYFDIVLLHVQQGPTWPVDSRPWQDGILEAERKQMAVSHGASVHGLPALRQVPGDEWLQIAMIRMNHTGTRMDGANPREHLLGNVPEVVDHVKQARQKNMGVISMKLVGEGSFTSHEDRQKSMRFAFHHAGVQCVTVGYKSPAEVDEAIDNVNLALA